MYEPAACILHYNGKIHGRLGIEFLGKCSERGVCLACIYIGPCCTIDDCIYVVLGNNPADGITVGNVQICGFLTFCLAASAALLLAKPAPAQTLTMNDLGYFEARGTNVLVYNNLYNGGFYDEKFAGMEIIQRGERLATGGGIRLMNTPEQWDIFGSRSPTRTTTSRPSSG